MTVFAEAGDGSLRLVANWNEIYQNQSDPWGQSGADPRLAIYYERSRRRLGNVLLGLCAQGDALEIGCGHGHALKALRLYWPLLRWQGADISKAAVDEASRLYPKTLFRVLDITDDVGAEPECDLVLLNEVWWYILHAVDDAIANCYGLLRSNGLLVLSQGFLAEQRYGNDIADGFNGAVCLFLERYSHLRLVYASYDESDLPLQHGVAAFRISE